jgi:predicted transcriptional regulator
MDADKLDKIERAFDLVVVRHKSLRAAAEELGISHETVRQYVSTYQQHLAKNHADCSIDERRATMQEELRYLQARAMQLLDKAEASGKHLAAIGALNSALSAFQHLRAITGVDTPKNVRQDSDLNVTVKWEEDD